MMSCLLSCLGCAGLAGGEQLGLSDVKPFGVSCLGQATQDGPWQSNVHVLLFACDGRPGHVMRLPTFPKVVATEVFILFK